MAQPASGLIRFTNANSDTVDISLPRFPYKTTINLPFSFQKLSNGLYDAWDEGTTYDKYSCTCEFELTAAQQLALNAFLRITGTSYGRAQELTLEMASDSGFFPFGPQESNVGPFDVAVEMTDRKGVGKQPWEYFICTLKIDKGNDAFPAYTLPTEVSEGDWDIEASGGTPSVDNCRFPPDFFKPKVDYRYTNTRVEDGVTKFIDRGHLADWYETRAATVMNESKTAALMELFIDTIRTAQFSMRTGSGYYAFGRDKGSNDGYLVDLIQDNFEITHVRYNEFKFNLALSYVDTEA